MEGQCQVYRRALTGRPVVSRRSVASSLRPFAPKADESDTTGGARRVLQREERSAGLALRHRSPKI